MSKTLRRLLRLERDVCGRDLLSRRRDRNCTLCATTSIALRLFPSESSHELLRSRPSTATRLPFVR